jgi:hypothetical protein
VAEMYFIVSDSAKDVARSVGIPTGSGPEFEPCPLNVGDLISYPSAPTVAFRVTERWFRVGNQEKPPRWYLTLESDGDPLAEPSQIL